MNPEESHHDKNFENFGESRTRLGELKESLNWVEILNGNQRILGNFNNEAIHNQMSNRLN